MVSTEERGNALGSHSDGRPPSHMTSSRTRLFIEQWKAALLSKVETTAHLCAVKWGGGKLLIRVGGLTVHFGRGRAIIIVRYRNIQKWYNMSFSLRSELDVMVNGIDVG